MVIVIVAIVIVLVIIQKEHKKAMTGLGLVELASFLDLFQKP